MRRLSPIPSALLCCLCLSCSSEAYNPWLLQELAAFAIQTDPATTVLDTLPQPPITVTALAIDPADPTLSDASHSWWWDIGDDVEGADVLTSMIPDGPHGPTVELDPTALTLLWASPEETLSASLPLHYRVETAEAEFDAVKLVSLIAPAPDEWEDSGDDDDSAEGDGSARPEGYNENPRITALSINQDVEIVDDQGSVLGIHTPVLVPSAEPDVGLHIRIRVEDDKDPGDTFGYMVWTAGCARLPTEDSVARDECPAITGWVYGCTATLGDPYVPREFGWSPLSDTADARLFIVVKDLEGGLAWQEIRVGG